MKKLYRVLPILADLIPTALCACDDVLFDTLSQCPDCGGNLTLYDTRTKKFAVISEGRKTRTIKVRVQRYRCTNCRTVVYSPQPFYPGTRTGAPVVDLCIALSTSKPYARVSTYLRQFGVIVDRWSVRNYVQKRYPVPPTVDVSGIRIPVSCILLASYSAQLSAGCTLSPYDILEACWFRPQAGIPASLSIKEIADFFK
jgi:hypothetical protein